MEDPPYDWYRLQVVKNQPRSVSQAKEYLPELGGCAYKYFLNRVVRAWDRPAAWLPQGLAVHEAAEFWERSGRKASLDEMKAVYREAYDRHTKRLLEDTPNTEFWSASGPYHGDRDIKRRAEIGLAMVEKYYDYYVNQKPGEVIWITPDGTPAIELGFSVEFGSVTVRGFIDQILHLLRDIKSGNKPGDMFQLAVYRYAVLDTYGVDFPVGDYWMGKTGKPTRSKYDLNQMTRDQVVDVFEKMDGGVKAEDFEPSPDPEKCRFCSVNQACQYAA